MRLTVALLFKEIPYRYRGKYRKVKKPTFEDLLKLRHDFEREERNMLILRHPYLTAEQSFKHMEEFPRERCGVIFGNYKNEKYAKIVTIEERLSGLKVREIFTYMLPYRFQSNKTMNDQNTFSKRNRSIGRKQKNIGTSIKPKIKRSASDSNWEKYKNIICKEESNMDKNKNNISTTGAYKKSKKITCSEMSNVMNNIAKCDSNMEEDKKKITRLVAIDCEMVGIGDGSESMVARVSIVNKFGYCLYDKYVKPRERVKDYRTAVSGIYPHHLQNGEEFAIVQKEVAEILRGRILVGHALKHDLAVLFLSHPWRSLRDTSRYKLFKDIIQTKTPSLKRLALELLGIEIQVGEHDSVEDARVAMQLYMLYRNKWESEIYSRK
ncbi:hypothetical protein M0802_006591 [Mischocyttarus mexicanus]|nr:hypothetical protein M0802_006591 [Mischocyttarus mexicanus]